MGFKYIQLIILVLLLACSNRKSNNETAQDAKPIKHNQDYFLLKDFIEEFLSNKQVKSDVITLVCNRHNDSLRFLIVDTYPIFDEREMTGYTYIKNRKVCIVGDELPPGFINIEFKEVPVEVKKRNDEFRNSNDISKLKHSDPFKQVICFKGKELIQCPQVDNTKVIDLFLP